MGDRKRDWCKKHLHRMEGENLIHRPDGTRACRACCNVRQSNSRKKQRTPRIHWGKFSMVELALIHWSFVKAPTGNLSAELYQTHRDLFDELVQHIDERNRASRSEMKPVQSTPNHKTLNNQIGSPPKLANQKEH